MKKLLIAAVAAAFFVSCGNTKDKFVDKLHEATEDVKNAESQEDVVKITAEMEEYHNGIKDEIQKIMDEDETAKKEIEEATEAYVKAVTEKSTDNIGAIE